MSAIVVAVLAVGVVASPANASEVPSPTFTPTTAQIASGINNLGDTLATSAEPIQLDAAQLEALSTDLSESVVVHNGGTVDRSDAQGYSVEGLGVVVSLPIVGDGIDFGSGVVGVFNDDLELQSTVEMNLDLDAVGGGSISAWQDNELVRSVTLSAEQISEAAAAAGYSVVVAKGGSWLDKLSACLASKGVPAALISLIGGLCIAACLVLAPCIVCLAAYLVGWGVQMTACINEVNAGKW